MVMDRHFFTHCSAASIARILMFSIVQTSSTFILTTQIAVHST